MTFEEWVIREGGYLNDSDPEAKSARRIALRAWHAATDAALERAAEEIVLIDKRHWFSKQSRFTEFLTAAIRALKDKQS